MYNNVQALGRALDISRLGLICQGKACKGRCTRGQGPIFHGNWLDLQAISPDKPPLLPGISRVGAFNFAHRGAPFEASEGIIPSSNTGFSGATGRGI